MRVSLAKYTDVLDFEVEETPGSRYMAKKTKIRWKLPKITDEQEAAIRDEIDAEFGPQDSSRKRKKVLEWRINKRKSTQWYFELDLEEPRNEFGNKDCTVGLGFHDGYCVCCSAKYYCRGSRQIIVKGADVEFLFQFGISSIRFNDVRQLTHAKYRNGSVSDIFTEFNKLVTVEIINQLKNVPKDQVSVTVLGMFEDDNQGMNLRSNFDWFTSPKPNWKSSDPTGTDVQIVTADGGNTYCHSNFLTRNSRVLSELLVSPTLKPFLLGLRDWRKIHMEAFLMYQYYGTTKKILQAPLTSLGVLKAAERYETWQMWTDTMKGLLKKNSHWFERAVAPKIFDFLGKCSKREEVATQNLIQKISQGLQGRSPPVTEKLGNEESENAGEDFEAGHNGRVQENQEAEANEAESGCHNRSTMNEMRSNELSQILESKGNSVSLLKVAQTHKSDGIWNDIILTLLEKDSDWFEWDLALELKTFLDNCPKRDEEATQKLIKTLSQLLDQPKPIGEATQVREHEDPNGRIVENTMYSQPGRAKRRRVTEKDPDQLTGNMNSRVETRPGPATVDKNLRRSTRLKADKRKKEGQTEEVQKRKRGFQTEDLSWKRALQVGAQNERNAFNSMGAGPGPRDIWKDPQLPKISIFPDMPDPEVKVEKVEPPEEENEDSAVMDGVGIHQVVQDYQDQDCVAVTVKEEEPASMDESSGNVEDSAGCGVIVSRWTLSRTADENV